jgi:response regulator RpfG family c-di-GMP phosphodiesterase
MNILYIEDDADIAEVYTLYLHSKFPDLKVFHYLNGAEGFTELANNTEKYSLVISDFNVPGKNGGEIFKFVNGQMLGIPFMILSGQDCSRDENFKSFFQSHVRNAFLLKPCPPEEFIEKVSWCLDTEKDKLKIYLKESKNIDEKVPVNSEVFLKINSIPCDVYVQLSADKYIKIINNDALFSTDIIIKLIAKGVKHFYINKSEISAYSESIAHTVFSLLKTKTSKMDEASKSQLTGKALELVKSNLLKCGFSKAIMDVTEEVINLQVDMIKASPELSKFMDKFQLFRKMNTDHSRLVSFLSVAIVKEIGWDSESTLHKMCLASLFHDVSLSDNFSDKVIDDAAFKQLSPTDQSIFHNHCEESAHIAKNFASVAPGMEQVILEHHELPDGTGFPKGLTAAHVHSLSACLHLADFASYLMWLENFEIEAIREKVALKREFYSKGFYRKPYDALVKVLSK